MKCRDKMFISRSLRRPKGYIRKSICCNCFFVEFAGVTSPTRLFKLKLVSTDKECVSKSQNHA